MVVVVLLLVYVDKVAVVVASVVVFAVGPEMIVRKLVGPEGRQGRGWGRLIGEAGRGDEEAGWRRGQGCRMRSQDRGQCESGGCCCCRLLGAAERRMQPEAEPERGPLALLLLLMLLLLPLLLLQLLLLALTLLALGLAVLFRVLLHFGVAVVGRGGG